jgi:hypothetical protein
MTEDADIRSTRESGFHPRTSQLTRDFRNFRGFSLPGTYAPGGAVEDYWACRERLAVADLSALRKFEVLGPDAEALMTATLTSDVRRLAVGQVTYSTMCDEAGAGQLSLGRERRPRRRLATPAHRGPGPQGLDQANDRSPAQSGGPGP